MTIEPDWPGVEARRAPCESVVSSTRLPSAESWTSYCEPPPQANFPARLGFVGSEMSAMTMPSE